MSLSRWSLYINRSSQVLRDATASVLRMSGTDEPDRRPKTLLTFDTKDTIRQYVLGSDADIGGYSTIHLDLEESGSNVGQRATGKFWGEMSLDVQPRVKGRIRAGYAGFRSPHRPTLFGEMMDDLSNYEYLALRVRLGGDPRSRHSYFVNIQTDSPITTDIWQHRLFLTRDDGAWEDVFIPLANFLRTNAGHIAPDKIQMNKERVRTFGLSFLGGNSGFAGSYELGIDSIRAVNIEDVPRPRRNQKTSPLSTEPDVD